MNHKLCEKLKQVDYRGVTKGWAIEISIHMNEDIHQLQVNMKEVSAIF